jgi:putative endonuclease
LQSGRDKNFYIGVTANLVLRINQHNSGTVQSTKSRIPLKLIYYEACLSKGDAFRREKYLKTGMGKRYLKNRLKEGLTG